MFKKLAVAGLILGIASSPALARDQVQIAGSSTVLPYAKIVAEEFGKVYSNFKTPVVESGGSSAGLKEFCKGVGPNTIDIANSSRQIKESEIKTCADNGISDILEVRIGYDGIVFATDKSVPQLAIDPVDIHNAIAAKIVVNGELKDNAFSTWKQVNSSFPDMEITMYIPGEKHGTREVFEEKVLLEGCKANGTYEYYISNGMDKKAAAKECMRVRKDGRSVDIDGDYTETLARLETNKTAIGVFGLAFYENNIDKLNVATVDQITPTVETISSGEYPVSRPLFFYVKKAHIGVIPGLAEYVKFFASDRMIGPDSPLAEYGLVSAPDEEREQLQTQVNSLQ